MMPTMVLAVSLVTMSGTSGGEGEGKSDQKGM